MCLVNFIEECFEVRRLRSRSHRLRGAPVVYGLL
jgi:hypothetical protein